ncbi:hypothetical protein [Kitasatospora fiedleri]|uniref:hypothetical protein n=1 Tax=Kitasatospora fiedleri TaxID=2991545 RepID=UPI00249C32A6|nr:hypothetical protein [Kitasatospora fiedleri]
MAWDPETGIAAGTNGQLSAAVAKAYKNGFKPGPAYTPNTTVHVSAHVIVSTDNKNLARIQKRWDAEVAKFGQPKNAADEYRFWRSICRTDTSGFCEGQFNKTFGLTAGGEDQPDLLQAGAVSVGASGVVRNLKDLQSLRGISREDFREMMEAAGYERAPMNENAAYGKFGEKDFGDLYTKGDRGVSFMYEAGDESTATAGDVHAGPYVKIQAKLKLYKEQINGKGKPKEWSRRIPGAGNPNPLSGLAEEVPAPVQGWLNENIPGPAAPRTGLNMPEVDPAAP